MMRRSVSRAASEECLRDPSLTKCDGRYYIAAISAQSKFSSPGEDRLKNRNNIAAAMAWVGVILCQVLTGLTTYCVEWDDKRKKWELPKGGAELRQPRDSTGSVDSSPFATARAELWEEAGIWLAWREMANFACLGQHGNLLTNGLEENRNGWIYTTIQENDTVIEHSNRTWMTLEEYRTERFRRQDYVKLLERIEGTPKLQEITRKANKASATEHGCARTAKLELDGNAIR